MIACALPRPATSWGMATVTKMYPCKSCGRPTPHLIQKPNHILHLLLSVFTAGLWLIVWAAITLNGRAPQCANCGTARGPFGL